MKTPAMALATLLSLSACDAGDDIITRDGWVRAAPPGAAMTAGYLTIENRDNSDIVLVSVTSPDYESIEIHETLLIEGIAKMREVSSPLIASGGIWELEPGGAHLMLMKPTREITPGDNVVINFEFSGGESRSLNLPVRQSKDSE